MKKTYGGGYTKNEWCKPDKFMEPYVGKIYLMNNLTDQPPEDIDTTALLRSSEVLSMGINYYLNDPINFAEKDPEHFELIYDICHGKYRMKGNS